MRLTARLALVVGVVIVAASISGRSRRKQPPIRIGASLSLTG